MLLQIPNLLTLEEINQCRQRLQQAEWIDGKVSTGHQSAHLKNNLQLAQDSEAACVMGDMICQAFLNNPLAFSAALPRTILPPMFNCYQHGGHFGQHVDNAIRKNPSNNQPMRTDLSCTVFFTNPDEYEGGELLIEDTFGSKSVKLPAGHAIFWIQSFIASDAQRHILFKLDQNIQKLTQILGATHSEVISLTGIYHNLLREWSDL
jgi:PKHD-type hydroxylase